MEVPEFLRQKYYSLPSYDKFELRDLMKWVQFGLFQVQESDLREMPIAR